MVRQQHVPRRQLVDELAAVHDDVPLILLIAPAGYGKTIALQQWAATDPRPFGWLTAEPADADPGRLLRRVARALHAVQPVDAAIWRALALPDYEGVAAAVPRLATMVHGRPWLLVIDDLHVIGGSAGYQVLLALAEHLPTGCHLVVGGRNRLGLPVGGLRSEGRCAEFGPDQLRLTGAEAGTLIEMAGARLTEPGVLALTRRFEGWPAGIYLAALSLRDRPGPAGRLTGADTYLAEYFRDVVLADEPAATVRFLLRTSPLDSLSPSLCDAVLRRQGSGQTLAGIAGRNLFLAPIDAAVRSYRCHPVFRQMLLAELRRREPAAERSVHRRAAAWYERRQLAEPAVRHAVAAGDAPATARLVVRHGRQLIDDGRAGTLAAALDSLGRDVIEQEPQLAALAGWIYAFAGRPGQPAACLDAATAGEALAAPRAAAAVARLRAALTPDGIDGMLGSARRAARTERPGSDWYGPTMVLLGFAEDLTGNTVLAMTYFARAARVGPEQPTAAALALAALGWDAFDRHENAAGAAFAKESAALLEPPLQQGGWSVLTHLIGARVALDSDDRVAFAELIGRARHASSRARAFPWLTAAASIRLARLALDAGDLDEAQRSAVDARLALADLTTTGVLVDRYQELEDDLGHRPERAGAGRAAGLTTAERRVLNLLPTHLTLHQIAGQLRLSRNTVKTQVAAVYRKLDASDRAEAVRHGRDLGLLS